MMKILEVFYVPFVLWTKSNDNQLNDRFVRLNFNHTLLNIDYILTLQN